MSTQSNAINASTVASWKAVVKECEVIGAQRERARIVAIAGCGEGMNRGATAFEIATTTDMTVDQARDALASGTWQREALASAPQNVKQIAEIHSFLGYKPATP